MSLLSPSSIAVIGASATEGKVGHDILKNLKTQGFAGKIFPINPKGGTILELPVHTQVSKVEGSIDLAVIVIPAKLVAGALRECGEKKIKHVVVISAGFSETHTDEGKKMEEELVHIAQEYGIHMVGPNCLGLVRPPAQMNASFAKELPPSGGIAVISQSGAMGVALMDAAVSSGIGLSAFVSIGNKACIDETDMLKLLGEDESTTVIGLYLESIKHGRAFMAAAQDIIQKKPIVLLKAGVSDEGRKAASSHTGALAGSDSAITALCAQTGIIRAGNAEEFIDALAALATQPRLPTNNIAIITNAGGPGILATDAAAGGRAGAQHVAPLRLPALKGANAKTLAEQLPTAASVHNPIDVLGDGGADRYKAAIDTCCIDPSIDGLVILLTPQVMTPVENIANTIVTCMKDTPLMPVTCAFMGGQTVEEGKKILRKAGIPVFDTPERAVAVMKELREARLWTLDSGLLESSVQGLESRSKNAKHASKILERHQGLLPEKETTELFTAYNLPIPKQALATTVEEAVNIAQEIGYPVIAKISSPDILHKSDVGGVRAHLQNDKEVKEAYEEIMRNVTKTPGTRLQAQEKSRVQSPESKDPKINGILIQQFLPAGHEFIIGGLQDPSFGPLVMVGLGGIYTELFNDTSFRIAPVTQEEAYRMLEELDSWKLLLGMRGEQQSDIDDLAQCIANVSLMMTENPQISELDINPILVRSDGVTVADAKVVLYDAQSET